MLNLCATQAPHGWPILTYFRVAEVIINLCSLRGKTQTQNMNLNLAAKAKAPEICVGEASGMLSLREAVLLILHLLEHNNYSPIKCDRRGFVFV